MAVFVCGQETKWALSLQANTSNANSGPNDLGQLPHSFRTGNHGWTCALRMMPCYFDPRSSIIPISLVEKQHSYMNLWSIWCVSQISTIVAVGNFMYVYFVRGISFVWVLLKFVRDSLNTRLFVLFCLFFFLNQFLSRIFWNKTKKRKSRPIIALNVPWWTSNNIVSLEFAFKLAPFNWLLTD